MDWQRIGVRIAFIFIVAVIVGLIYVLWLVYRPLEIYYDVTQPYEILNENKTVKAGQPVLVRQTYCKTGSYPTSIIIILEDGFYETLRIIESAVEEGCYDNPSRSAVIPLYTTSGEYRIRYRIIVHVNPFRDVVYEFVSEEFNVVNDLTPI